jgi:hypothetical protein
MVQKTITADLTQTAATLKHVHKHVTWKQRYQMRFGLTVLPPTKLPECKGLLVIRNCDASPSERREFKYINNGGLCTDGRSDAVKMLQRILGKNEQQRSSE